MNDRTAQNLHLKTCHKPARLVTNEPRFRQLLNDIDWARLPIAVKKRFSSKIDPSQPKVYRGHIMHTRMNWIGKLLSRCMLLLGGSLPLDSDNAGAAAVVTVSANDVDESQVWTRQYQRPKGTPQLIQSSKAFSGPTGLEEYLGHGIGMTLNLAVSEKSLDFIADRYFVEVFSKRIYLPKFFCPGALTISHYDLGNNSFTFGMRLVHPLFGEVISQEIFFKDL